MSRSHSTSNPSASAVVPVQARRQGRTLTIVIKPVGRGRHSIYFSIDSNGTAIFQFRKPPDFRLSDHRNESEASLVVEPSAMAPSFPIPSILGSEIHVDSAAIVPMESLLRETRAPLTKTVAVSGERRQENLSILLVPFHHSFAWTDDFSVGQTLSGP